MAMVIIRAVPPIEPFYFSFGRLLREAREQIGLSQEQLGARLTPKMTRASIANMESGKQRVLAKTLVDLAEALAVDVVKLLPVQQSRQSTNLTGIEAELGAVLDLSPDKLKELASKLEQPTKD
jgi:transcriptional regulator with XRE-family HTH domain